MRKITEAEEFALPRRWRGDANRKRRAVIRAVEILEDVYDDGGYLGFPDFQEAAKREAEVRYALNPLIAKIIAEVVGLLIVWWLTREKRGDQNDVAEALACWADPDD